MKAEKHLEPPADERQYLELGLLVGALEASADAVEIDDVEGNVVYVNDSWCRLFEQERPDVIDKHWAHF